MKDSLITILAVISLILSIVGLTLRYVIKITEVEELPTEKAIDSEISKDSLLQIQYNNLKLRVDSLELRLSEATENLNNSDSTLYDKLNSLEKSLNSLRRDFKVHRDGIIFNRD